MSMGSRLTPWFPFSFSVTRSVNMEKAREYGEKALRLDPGYVLARNLLKTIDRIEGK